MNPFNQKLDEILDKYYAPIKLPDSNRGGLKQAIRKAVAEDMLELVEHPHQILIQIDDIEYLNGGYVSRVELREKIKEWSER